MASTKSAIRYATALMDLGLAQGKIERLEKDLAYFEQVMHTSNDFRIFLNSPVIRDDKKIAIYHQILSNFDELTMGFFSLVTKKVENSCFLKLRVNFIDCSKNIGILYQER